MDTGQRAQGDWSIFGYEEKIDGERNATALYRNYIHTSGWAIGENIYQCHAPVSI